MKVKQNYSKKVSSPLTTYVRPKVREAFVAIADKEERSVADELRRLVERHVEEKEAA